MIDRIEINLLPAEYRVHRRPMYWHREVIYPVLAVVALAVVLLLRQMMFVNEIAILERDIEAAQKEIDRNKHVLKEIRLLREAKERTREKITALQRISVNREKWVRLQETFCAELPPRTWLTVIEEKRSVPPVLEVRGKTYSVAEVAAYMSLLTESDFIQSVDLNTIEMGRDQNSPYEFHIVCTLNPNARLSDDGEVSPAVDEREAGGE